MPRREARIKVSIWDDEDFLSLPMDAQRLYLMYASQSGLSHAGVLVIPRREWVNLSPDDDARERVAAARLVLERERFVLVDDDTDELLVRSYIRNDVADGAPGTFRAAMDAAIAVRSPKLRDELRRELMRLDVGEIEQKKAGWKQEAPSVALQRALVALGGAGPPGSRAETVEATSPPHSGQDSTEHGMVHGSESRSGVGVGDGESVQSVGDSASSAESKKAEKNDRDDIRELCDRLADRVEGNGAKRPRVTEGWRDAARLLLDRDGRDHATALRLIDWVQSDDFWTSNCLSMPTFREKYDQLLLKAKNTARWRLATPAGTDSGLSDAEVNAILQRGRRDYPPPPAELDDDPEGRSAWYATKRDERRAADRADAERLLRTDAQAQSILARFRKTS